MSTVQMEQRLENVELVAEAVVTLSERIDRAS